MIHLFLSVWVFCALVCLSIQFLEAREGIGPPGTELEMIMRHDASSGIEPRFSGQTVGSLKGLSHLPSP